MKEPRQTAGLFEWVVAGLGLTLVITALVLYYLNRSGGG